LVYGGQSLQRTGTPARVPRREISARIASERRYATANKAAHPFIKSEM
jgi:hypothetical protein